MDMGETRVTTTHVHLVLLPTILRSAYMALNTLQQDWLL